MTTMDIDEARRIALAQANGFHSNVAFELASLVCAQHGEAAMRQLCAIKADIQRINHARKIGQPDNVRYFAADAATIGNDDSIPA